MHPHQEQMLHHGHGHSHSHSHSHSTATTTSPTASKINREIGNNAKPESWGRQPVTALEQTQAPSQLQASRSHTPFLSGLDRPAQQHRPEHEQEQEQEQEQLQLQLPSHRLQQLQSQSQSQSQSQQSGQGQSLESPSSSTSSSTHHHQLSGHHLQSSNPNNSSTSTSTSTSTNTNPGLGPNPSRRANTSQQAPSPSPPTSSPSLLSSSSSPSSSYSSSTVTPTASALPQRLPVLSPSLASSCISPLDPFTSHDGYHSSTWTRPVPTPTIAAAPLSPSRHYHHHHHHHYQYHHPRPHLHQQQQQQQQQQQYYSPPSANASAQARAAAQSLPPADDLIVSPISETPPSTQSVFRNLNHFEDLSAFTTAAAIPNSSSHGPAVPAPELALAPASPVAVSVPVPVPVPGRVPASISNHSPTRDPLFGITPLLEEAGFDFEPHPATGNRDRVVDSASLYVPAAVSRSPSASAALSHAVSHDVAHLTIDDNRSDDWFRYTTRESTISKYNKLISDHNQAMTASMAAERADVLDQQLTNYGSSSFTPLPPIRRTSTFDLLRKKGLVVDDESDSAPSPVDNDNDNDNNADVPLVHSMRGEMAHQNGHDYGQLSADQGQSSPHSGGQQLPHQHQPPSQNNQSHQSPPAQQPPNVVMAAPAPAESAASQQPAFAQIHQQPVFMGRGGAQFPPGRAPLMNGNPVQRFPPGGPWRLEESHLSEPLNPSHRNRSANSPPQPQFQPQSQPQPQPHEQSNYSAYDKETEAVPTSSGSTSASIQRYQTRQRNNSVPPSSAQRFPALFEPQSSHSQQPGQNPHPLSRGQYSDDSTNGARGGSELRSSKDMGVRVDQVSVSSVASDDERKTGPGSLFSLGNRRNTGEQGNPQIGTPEKKRNFFGTVMGHNQSQPKPMSNLGLAKPSTLDRHDVASTHSTGDSAPKKKRLSELKGMIKGVGNAKEGAKEAARDDQAIKPNTAHAPSNLGQGHMRSPLGFIEFQKPLRSPGSPPLVGQSSFVVQQRPQAPNGQVGPMANPPSVGIGRASTAGPYPPQAQQPPSDEGRKKSSSESFLGGFFNKQANKPKEPRSQPNPPASSPPTQRPMQFAPMQPSQSFRPGQMQHPGQPLGPHPMYAGQPQFPQGAAGQPGAQRSMTPDQLSPQTGEPLSPSFVQMAQAVTIRRPSEITVSPPQPGNAPALSPPRSNMPSQQNSQASMRLSPGPSPLGPAQNQQSDDDDDGSVLKDSPELSQGSFQDQPNVGNPSVVPRDLPNRKPVGSGPSKQDGSFMTSAQPLSTRLHERRLSEQNSLVGTPDWQGHMRQPSLPSSSTSLVPSQHDRSGSPRLQGSTSSTERQGSTDGPGVSHNPSGQPGISAGLGHQQSPPIWGQNGLRPGPQFTGVQASRHTGSPAPSMDQSKLSKFFGAYDGGKAPANPHAPKDKSAASKFFSAFKRGSKQTESNPPHQKRPSPNQQTPPQVMRPGVPAEPAQPGQPSQAGQQRKHPAQPSQPSQPNQSSQHIPQQSGIPRPIMNGPAPPGPLPTQPQGSIPQGLGGGQMPPQVHAGRGQMSPPMMHGGRGQTPPQIPAVRGPIPQQQTQAPPLAQVPNKPRVPGEPQYDQVPIPRGYEAVHGYGHDRILVSPSPYNVGRPSFPPPQFLQYQSMHRQPVPPQPWDPRMMPPQAGAPHAPIPGPTQPGPQGAMPQPIQYPAQQPQAQQLQVQASSQNSSPGPQGSLSHAPQSPPLHQQSSPSQPGHQSGQSSITEQQHLGSQLAPNLAAQGPNAESHSDLRRPHSPASQTPSSSNWGSVPESNNSPASMVRHEPAGRTQVTQPDHPSHYTSSYSSNDDSRGLQTQHIATAINHQHAHPQGPPSEPRHVDLPADEYGRASPQMQAGDSPNLHPPTVRANEVEYQVATDLKDKPTSTDATRLTSRMSVSNEPPRSTSLSPRDTSNRAMSVSPEPLSQRSVPVHQVSEPSMNINIERANEFKKDTDDDIYDATPRMDNAQPQDEDHMQENTKYAGSEKGRVIMNGVVIAGAAAAIGGEGTGGSRGTSFFSGPEDSDTEDITPQRDQQITLNMEPEEKILVDQPVELAAVNDDDDGLPMMSATSYPGQEWNPYGAGEFGDWE